MPTPATVSPSLLIFTYAEYGQANVNLATAYELALAGVNVHIASFLALKTRVLRIQELVDRHASRDGGKPTGSVTFHECADIPSWREAVNKLGMAKGNTAHPHGVFGALGSYPKMDSYVFPWGHEDYLAVVECCKKIIATVRPDLVMVDYLFSLAQDACKVAGQKFIVISPNAIKDLVLIGQPYLAVFWKYPAMSSGFPFPLMWWQILLNICLVIRFAIYLRTSPRIRQLQAIRRSLGFDYFPGNQRNRLFSGVKYISAALPETDYPFVVPKEILLCGPIIMPFDPLEESDPALMKWLDNGPTVLVNLGSHVLADESAAEEMAGAFRILMARHNQRGAGKIQVLWKAMPSGDTQKVIDEVIGKEIEEGQVKVLPWLEAEPVSILQHPNVVCTVHHGGANSFYEGVWSGVPHIVLPVWFDTYDYATRVEFLRIGIFGNKTCSPGVRTEEFSEALVRITGDGEEANEFRTSARRLKALCRMKGSGRKLASEAVLREISDTYALSI